MNPYLAGVGIGCVLLLTFVVMGRGLGATGAFSAVVATGVASVAPDHASQHPIYATYLGEGTTHPLKDWLVFEIIGVLIGGALSGALAGRFRRAVDKGPNVTIQGRLMFAFGGGAIMGFGAKLARGCTSGQALSGGSVLSVGSWLFIIGAFGMGYLAAPLFRRQWT